MGSKITLAQGSKRKKIVPKETEKIVTYIVTWTQFVLNVSHRTRNGERERERDLPPTLIGPLWAVKVSTNSRLRQANIHVKNDIPHSTY